MQDNNDIWRPRWDGSELEDFDESMFIVKFESETNNMNYCKFEYNNKIICCGYKKMNDITACIYDEFCTLFNVKKIGTHYALIRKRYYVFYSVNYDDKRNKMKEDKILSHLSRDKKISLLENTKDMIRTLYILYDILGIYTNDGHICIRKIQDRDYAIKFKMTGVNDSVYVDNDSVIPDTAYKLWFDDEDHFDEVTKKVCPVDSHSVGSYIVSIKDKMMDIVKRIDKTYIYIVSLIINRIKDRLELMDI